MQALSDGLLAEAPGIETDDAPREAAPWQALEQEDLVPLHPRTLKIIRTGVDGPAACTNRAWIAALAIGMLAGVLLGVRMMPNVDMPISGGWFACVCLMIIHLFHKTLPLLRQQVAEGGHVAQLLTSRVSAACAKAVGRFSIFMRALQGSFVLSQCIAYFYALSLAADTQRMDKVDAFSMVIFFGGFVVGSFMLVSMICLIVCSCAVLDDRLKRLTVQAQGATTMERLRAVSLTLRELDHDVQQAVVALRPAVLTVRTHLARSPPLGA